MNTLKVTLPKEEYTTLEYSQNNQVGMATINTALRHFEHKLVFPWHLSVVILCAEKNQDMIPTKAENDLLLAFEDTLRQAIQANGNAVFLASITKNGYRELIWRVHQPEAANDYLHDLIETENHPRPFDFTLEADEGWFKTEWHFNMLDKIPDYDMPGKK